MVLVHMDAEIKNDLKEFLCNI